MSQKSGITYFIKRYLWLILFGITLIHDLSFITYLANKDGIGISASGSKPCYIAA